MAQGREAVCGGRRGQDPRLSREPSAPRAKLIGSDQCRAKTLASNAGEGLCRYSGWCWCHPTLTATKHNAHQIGGISGANLLHDAGAMDFDGPWADAQVTTGLLV